MSSVRLGMSPRLRSATRQQTAAADAHDSLALVEASRAVVDAGWAAMPAVFGASLTDRMLGSLLLTGRGSTAAASLRSAARRFTDEGQDSLARIAEDEWNATELTLLREIRLLAGDWRPLPGMPRRRDLRTLGAAQRRDVRTAHALFAAVTAHDSTSVQRAIAAIGHNDPAKFSVLAYALYREARRRGLALKVPRKYDF